MVERYEEIDDLLHPNLKERALPFFIDWLIDRVIFVEIKAYSDEDAYLIFETMNDRGLSLNSTEILKGYLFSQVEPEELKIRLNDIWIARVSEIKRFQRKQILNSLNRG